MTDRQWRGIRILASSGASLLSYFWLVTFLHVWQAVILATCVGVLAGEYVSHRNDIHDQRKRRPPYDRR